MHDAKKYGKVLKAKHYAQQKLEEKKIHAELMSAEQRIKARKAKAAKKALDRATKTSNGQEPTQNKKKKSTVGAKQTAKKRRKIDKPEPSVPEPFKGVLDVNLCVAVAYEDGWFPGVVCDKLGDDSVRVRFLHPTRNGRYQFPSVKDKQIVPRHFIMAAPLNLYPVNARFYEIEQCQEMRELFKKFSVLFRKK